MGTTRSFALMAALGLIASCKLQASSRGSADPPPPADRPATYGVPRPLGGPEHQWSLLIRVDALSPGNDSWRDQRCTHDVEESSRRQQLVTDRLDVALTGILTRSPNCAVAALTLLAYGGNGCSEGDTSQPSGAYVVFSCPNGEPLNTTK